MAYLGTEHRDDFLSFELAHAARKLVPEILPVSPGDNVVITSETASDSRVVLATAQAAYAAGGHPIVIIYETFPEPSIDPPKPVQEALKVADIWYEFAVNYLLYTDTRIAASKASCKHTSYEGMDVDMMVRTIGKPDYPTMHKLGERLRDLCNAANVVRITDPNGTDLICPIERNPPQFLPGTGGPGQGYSLMLGGQSSFSPNFDETNGTIFFDGCLWPPSEIGPPVNPVALTIERGVISKVEGGPKPASSSDGWSPSTVTCCGHWCTPHSALTPVSSASPAESLKTSACSAVSTSDSARNDSDLRAIPTGSFCVPRSGPMMSRSNVRVSMFTRNWRNSAVRSAWNNESANAIC